MKGWCTPSILAAIIGIMGIAVFTYHAMMNKDPKQRRANFIAVLVKAAWTIIAVSVLFWLCTNDKKMSAWFVFGLFYLLPIAMMFIVMTAWMIQRGKQVEHMMAMQEMAPEALEEAADVEAKHQMMMTLGRPSSQGDDLSCYMYCNCKATGRTDCQHPQNTFCNCD